MSDRLPPHDIEAEEATVASMLADPSVIPEVATIVEPWEFFREKNGWIYSAVLELWRRGDHINEITVAHAMGADRLEEAGGLAYLSDITRRLPTSLGATWYAEIVHRDAIYRQVITTANHIETMAYEAPEDVAAVLARGEELLMRISAQRRRAITRSAREILMGTDGEGEGLYAATEQFFVDPYAITGLTTGWDELDAMLNGFNPSQVYTVIGDTSAGKSAFVQWVAWMLVSQMIPVLIITTEMSGREVAERILYMAAGIDREDLRQHGVTTGARERIRTAADTMMDWPLYITDVGQIGLSLLRSEVRRQVSAHAVRLVILDHLHHIDVPGTNGAQRMQEITSATKGIAMNESLPLLQVAHINRQAARDGVLTIHSARDSASIEQDSNVILLLESVRREDGSWAPMTEFEANDEMARTNGVNVRVRAGKFRGGRRGYDVRRFDWSQGGRFVPLAGVS